MRWFRTRPTALFCVSPDARFMHGFLKLLRSSSPTLPRPRPSCWRVTPRRLVKLAASLWGKAGQRSLDRSALVEAAAQITQAIKQVGGLPATPALRSEQIKLQVTLITPLVHVKGYAAPE